MTDSRIWLAAAASQGAARPVRSYRKVGFRCLEAHVRRWFNTLSALRQRRLKMRPNVNDSRNMAALPWPLSPDSTLTDWEREGLYRTYDFADGHVRLPLNNEQVLIVDRLREFCENALSLPQQYHETSLVNTFFALARQQAHRNIDDSPILHNSASISIAVTAQALVRNGLKRVALVCPTFDNISDLLHGNGLYPTPLDDQAAWSDSHYLGEALKTSDILFVVAPNNPTGYEPTKVEFESLVNECIKNSCILVIDFSFRFFSSLPNWDQYGYIHRSGDLDCILIEDTGKTWAAAGNKVGIVSSTRRYKDSIRRVSNEYLLRVEPEKLQIITEFIELESRSKRWIRDKITEAAHVAATNRSTLRLPLKELAIDIPHSESRVSVEWLGLPNEWNSLDLAMWLNTKGIATLPGRQFYWAYPDRGNSNLRIALLRSPSYFQEGTEALVRCLNAYSRRTKGG